jgi:hypothetical protein
MWQLRKELKLWLYKNGFYSAMLQMGHERRLTPIILATPEDWGFETQDPILTNKKLGMVVYICDPSYSKRVK